LAVPVEVGSRGLGPMRERYPDGIRGRLELQAGIGPPRTAVSVGPEDMCDQRPYPCNAGIGSFG
jgi:hypothetical protein